MQIHQSLYKLVTTTDCAGDDVRGTVYELGHAVHYHIRAQGCGAQKQRTERVVYYELRFSCVRDLGERRDVGNAQRRISYAFRVNDEQFQ